jgi:hypothetical protein
MTGIFISYREDDAKPWALMLADDLVNVFGDEHVFLDKDTLHAGSWREQITQALNRSKVVLVVIGRKWMSITDDSGRCRLDSPTDVHRQEIASALSRNDVTVIPVRVDGAPLPRPEKLPEDIRLLTEQQSRELSDNSARREVDLRQLIGDIERVTGLKARNSKTKEVGQNTSAGKRPLLSAGPIIFSIVLSVVLLVIVDLGLGWTLEAREKSFVVLLVFLLTLAVSWWRKRSGGIKG